jgi:hypothetical protein
MQPQMSLHRNPSPATIVTSSYLRLNMCVAATATAMASQRLLGRRRFCCDVLPERNLDRHPRNKEEREYIQFRQAEPAIEDHINFVRTQAEHGPVNLIDKFRHQLSHAKPNNHKGEAKNPTVEQDLANSFENTIRLICHF